MNDPMAHAEVILTTIKTAYPQYHAEIEETVDSPSTIAAAVYGVAKEDLAAVRQLINDLDWEIFGTTEMALMPLVVDRPSTEAHYPEYLQYSEHDAPLCLGALAEIDALFGLHANMKVAVTMTDRHWPAPAQAPALDMSPDEWALAA